MITLNYMLEQKASLFEGMTDRGLSTLFSSYCQFVEQFSL
jgi:hypothetical protein